MNMEKVTAGKSLKNTSYIKYIFGLAGVLILGVALFWSISEDVFSSEYATFSLFRNGHVETLENDEGEIFTGDLRFGRYEGFGTLEYADGLIHYEGYFRRGLREGFGIFTTPYFIY